MPIIRIDDKGVNIQDKKKRLAKQSSVALILVAIVSIATYTYIGPDEGIMVGLLVPTFASLLNLLSE